MAQMMPPEEWHRQRESLSRPWTVVALVVFSAFSVVWGLLAGDLNVGQLLLSLLAVWITYSMWIAKTWAFTVSFMLVSLCAGALATIAVVQMVLLERGVNAGLLWPLLTATIWIVLLMHPATKRFAGVSGRPRSG